MELQQVLVCVLILAVCVTCNPTTKRLHPCYKEEELEDAARNKLHHHYRQEDFPTQASTVPHNCPLDLYKKDHSMAGRSISPWAYVERNLPEHYPSTYYEAQCLCKGCIVPDEYGEPTESSDYNSAPVSHSRVFLKRELCEQTGEERRYHLRSVTVNVTVACTCVRPQLTIVN